MRAHFGEAPPDGRGLKLVAADPPDLCAPPTPAGEVPTLVLVNNEPGVIHAPGPDAHEVRASVAMVSEWEGSALLDAAAKTALEATFVPVNCAAHSETRATQSLCEVVAAADE